MPRKQRGDRPQDSDSEDRRRCGSLPVHFSHLPETDSLVFIRIPESQGPLSTPHVPGLLTGVPVNPVPSLRRRLHCHPHVADRKTEAQSDQVIWRRCPAGGGAQEAAFGTHASTTVLCRPFQMGVTDDRMTEGTCGAYKVSGTGDALGN